MSLQKISQMMGISKVSVNENLCSTILKHHDQVIKWPNEEERRNIKCIIRNIHDFVNCLGVIDGTLFPLAFVPTVNAEDYFTRNGDYALKGLVICEDNARITWIEMEWLGNVNNN